jgi:hypothetical protein
VVVQFATRRSASVAVHVTVVDPSGNVDPLGGVHDDVIGSLPPATVGSPYGTATGVVEVTGSIAGQEICGGSGVGPVGVGVSEPLQPAAIAPARRSGAMRAGYHDVFNEATPG